MGSNPTRSARMDLPQAPLERRDEILALLTDYIRRNRLIPVNSRDFTGEVDEYAYAFEGEDDLLHLAISRKDRQPIEVEEAQEVVQFLLPDIPPGLIWVKPGTLEHHFYLGHDELLRNRE